MYCSFFSLNTSEEQLTAIVQFFDGRNELTDCGNEKFNESHLIKAANSMVATNPMAVESEVMNDHGE
jgi:hypothetical protein